ncbi:AAA family ATPase [Engelhardtia mirabilis]|uniref:ATPase RavA n=1 Tax=Engelhardtia mirabilis TaxID=2528011 RepID=A0A518BMP8_9BACT|nr:ATPase RavA [Planctomycetes bacterium Pla133]QDV02553.1 ATPase RavA [Planctomycetes bacterium Pla86]
MTQVDQGTLERLRAAHQSIKSELQRTIVGQDQVVDQLLIAILCRGHCLLEGVPGLAKTLMISSLAQTMHLSFNRIQFTPDLMPSDITGTELLQIDPESGARSFQFAKGPIFANVVLADEINRTPPKTQAALLESMVERQVSAGGKRHELPDPFFVLATQNPIEQEGTYPLPEAQLDRFMFMVRVPYPTIDEEREILRRTTGEALAQPDAVLAGEELLAIQRAVRAMPVADHVFDYALALTRGTRVRGDAPLAFLTDWISWGAGPRASQFLILGAKAHAAVAGRDHVAIEDVRAIVHPVLRHRIVTTFSAAAEGITSDAIIDRLLKEVDPGATVGAGIPSVPAAS